MWRGSFGECVQEGKESENGKEENGGEFREFGETKEESGENDVFPGGLLEETKKEVEGEEEKGRDADVGGHVVPMSDRVRVEDEEGGGDESGKRPAELASPEKKKEPQ